MLFAAQAVLAGALLGGCCWAANLWPGTQTWRQAAVSRLFWWALPFGSIAVLNGASPGHALWLACAAWAGAWIPHTAMPDTRSGAGEMLTDAAVVVLRCLALLAPPAAVFWTCGAFWVAMAAAAFGAMPCVLLGNLVTLPLPGLRNKRHMAGALFGVSTGVWIVIAIMAPTPGIDRLN